MTGKKHNYTELSNATISPDRKAVISKRDDGVFTIGQRVSLKEEKSVMNVFLSGALHISDAEGLQNLRDSINVALEKIN